MLRNAMYRSGRTSTAPFGEIDGDRANPAWVQANRLFHHCILDGSGVRRLSDVVRVLRGCSELYQFWSCSKGRDPDRDIVAEHREIAERTLAGDEDGASSALTQHIERTTDRLIAHLNRDAAANTGTA